MILLQVQIDDPEKAAVQRSPCCFLGFLHVFMCNGKPWNGAVHRLQCGMLCHDVLETTFTQSRNVALFRSQIKDAETTEFTNSSETCRPWEVPIRFKKVMMMAKVHTSRVLLHPKQIFTCWNIHVFQSCEFSLFFFFKPFLLVALLFFCLTCWQSMIL